MKALVVKKTNSRKTHQLPTRPQILKALAAIGILLAGLSNSVRADSTVQVAQDTSTSAVLGTAKLAGTSTTLPTSSSRHALIRFDLTDPNLNLPAANGVKKATLTVFVTSITKPGNVNVSLVTQNWSEIVTNGAVLVPTTGTPFSSFVLTSSSKRRFVTIDVTSQVEGWLADPSSNFGFALTTDSGTNTSVAFGSKEGYGTGYPATLTIDDLPDIADAGGNVGIGTSNPWSLLANTPNNIYGTDGYGVSSTSIAWYSDGFGYAAGFYNPGSSVAGGGVVIGTAGTSARVLDLNANGASVMVVGGNGDVGIGKTTPVARLHIKQSADSFPGDALVVERQADASQWLIGMDNSDSLLFRARDASGTLASGYAYLSPTSFGLISTSDRRAKKDIAPMEACLDRVMQLKPSAFRYKNATENAPLNYGFIAQEIETVFPNLVLEKDGLKTLATDCLIAVNTRAIQELKQQKDAEIHQQQVELEALKARVAELEAHESRLATMAKEIADLKQVVAQLAADGKNAKLAGRAASTSRSPSGAREPLITASADQ